MKFETIRYEKQDRIGLITLNRPESLNAMNKQLITELNRLLDEIQMDDEAGVLVVTGQEKFFAAGADIKEIQTIAAPTEVYDYAGFAQVMYNKIDFFCKPVIAAVNGLALGGGCELALACDIRIAAENAVFGLPEIKIGVMPGGGGTQRLPRLVGVGRAKELLYTGNSIDAGEAYRIGLVNKVVPIKSLMAEAKEMARIILERPAFALSMIKTAVNEGMNMHLRAALAYEMRCFEILFSTEDQKEGMTAFLEKRKPEFTGR